MGPIEIFQKIISIQQQIIYCSVLRSESGSVPFFCDFMAADHIFKTKTKRHLNPMAGQTVTFPSRPSPLSHETQSCLRCFYAFVPLGLLIHPLGKVGTYSLERSTETVHGGLPISCGWKKSSVSEHSIAQWRENGQEKGDVHHSYGEIPQIAIFSSTILKQLKKQLKPFPEKEKKALEALKGKDEHDFVRSILTQAFLHYKCEKKNQISPPSKREEDRQRKGKIESLQRKVKKWMVENQDSVLKTLMNVQNPNRSLPTGSRILNQSLL